MSISMDILILKILVFINKHLIIFEHFDLFIIY